MLGKYRYLLLFLGLVMAASAAMPATTKEKVLPQKCVAFITTHFAGYTIAHINVDKDWIWTKGYEVFFTDGTEIEFDKNGDWKEVDGQKKTIPSAYIPHPIHEYLKQHFPDENIVTIEKDKNEYEIKLLNGLEVSFYKDGRLKEID